jgi:TolB-like protein/Tfp pilus assembly protein PilF
MARQVTEQPRRLRSVRPEVPAGIEDVVHRALQKEPAKRWPSVSEFVAALESGTVTQARARSRTAVAIAVLPFVNLSTDPENEYLSDGLTEELINTLATVQGIRVASRTSVFALKGKPQDVRAIGALLDCAYVIEGTVRRVGQQLRITAQLSSTDDGALRWSHRYDRRLDDAFALQDEISQTIVSALWSTQFVDLPAPAAPRYTPTARAYSLYLKGRYDMNQRTQAGVANAIRYFQEAIQEDPKYALAYTGLADSYALQLDYRSIPVHEGLDLAKQYATQAIALDPQLAEPHASLAWRYFIYDWEWDAAVREFRRAIELDPRYAWAHQLYGFVLSAMSQHGEALVESHTAVELDPGSVSARRALGWNYYYARRWDQARYHLERAIAMNPNAEETYRVLGHVLAVEGNHDEAERVLREASAMPEAGTYTRATLAYALARAGKQDEAREILRELTAESSAGYVSPVAFATIHIALGDTGKSLDWAEAAFQERRGWLAYVKVNPLMDPLRGNERFERLVARMKLPS